MGFTVIQIADLLARADGLALTDSPTIRARVRHYAAKGLLTEGEVIDGRGTQVFPRREVYRASVLNALGDVPMDIRGLRDVMDAAKEPFPTQLLGPGSYAPSMKTDSGWHSRGGLFDSVRGVAAGENWSLVLVTYPPLPLEIEEGDASGSLRGRFQWDDAPAQHRNVVRFDGAKPRTLTTLDLTALFLPLLAFVGLPD